MLKSRSLIALGGLLHDIGKFLQRTSNPPEVQHKDSFKYPHAEISYRITQEILDALGITDKRERELVLSACFHHRPDTDYKEASPEMYPVRVLFRLVDWFTSAERSKEAEKETRREFKRLRPVFEVVDIGKGTSQEEYFYKLVPLSLKKVGKTHPLFPVKRSEAPGYESYKEAKAELWGDYDTLYREFIKHALKPKNFKTLGHRLSYIYHLLYKYTWCVPASIYDKENYTSHYPDISLFDHSRVVAALASSLYTPKNLEILKEFKGDIYETASRLKLTIFEGDISGIQKFIYDIANVDGVAKRLRGRSVFLSFLPELIGRFILRELKYPWINLLYAGGGKFQAIVGYEEGIEEKLEKLATLVERSLLKTFGGKLGFVIYYHTLHLSDIKDYPKVVEELLDKGVEAKKRKFVNVIHDFEELVNKEIKKSVERCSSCGWEFVEKEGGFCKLCEGFKELGDAVVKSDMVLFTSKPLKEKGIFLEDVGGIYLTDRPLSSEDFEDAFLINNPEEFESKTLATGFRFLANVVPKGESGVKSFEEMAEDIEEGDKKLAYVLADVDNLGYVFMNGLGDKYTISRVAALSRSLDLFFSGYLNTLFEKDEYKGKIYTLYAGGDDLFIIAPWEVAIKVAQDIRRDFGDYTCHNPSFGLSCGIFTANHTYPVRLAYEGVKKAEDRAKENPGKDSVCVLGEVLKWKELTTALRNAEKLAEQIKLGRIPRTSFYKVYLLLRQFREEEREEERYMFYPLFFYFVKRNIKEELQETFVDTFLDKNKEVMKNALFIAKYVLMKTRDVKKPMEETFK
ncbi:type III-A CRISPR-associated protein Cas10/Csm1 [Aquifex sp.]